MLNYEQSLLNLNIGDIVTLDIGVIAHGGHFVARHNNQAIFVRHGITGEIANVKITSSAANNGVENIKRI